VGLESVFEEVMVSVVGHIAVIRPDLGQIELAQWL
jgi:hypothetical protein